MGLDGAISNRPELNSDGAISNRPELNSNEFRILTNDDENTWNQIGDGILHIELRNWADVVLIAPCSAHSLSGIANGACDGLLVSPYRVNRQPQIIIIGNYLFNR